MNNFSQNHPTAITCIVEYVNGKGKAKRTEVRIQNSEVSRRKRQVFIGLFGFFGFVESFA